MDIYVYMLAAALYFAPPCWFQKTKFSLIIWRERVVSHQLKPNRSVQVISDETDTVDEEYCTKMCKFSNYLIFLQDTTDNSSTA
jgi:hypothetical protein